MRFEPDSQIEHESRVKKWLCRQPQRDLNGVEPCRKLYLRRRAEAVPTFQSRVRLHLPSRSRRGNPYIEIR